MPEESPAIQIAVLQTQVNSLSTDIAELKADVKNLTAIMNRGRGAFAASLALAGTIGAAVVETIGYFMGKH